MAFRFNIKFLVALTIVCALLFLPIVDARQRPKRSDLENVPSISASGYVVPLQGGETCSKTGECTNILPAPAANKTLKYLALGRGILTYSCHGRKSYETPLYVSQDTSLWDAAPLIPRIANEELFHTIIPQLYEFDYTKLANSTLVCIGFINTLQDTAVADLFNVGAIAISVQEKINSPQLPTLNLEWAHEVSTDAEWDVYRVETVGGRAPATCAGEEGDFQTDYAAEYWFYHE